MLKPAGRQSLYRKHWKLIAFTGVCAAVLAVYLASIETDRTATPADTSLSDRAGDISASELASSGSLFAPRVQRGPRQSESNDSAGSPFDGLNDVDELSEEEIRLLHAYQQADLELMLNDLDAMVIGTDTDDGSEMTVREIRDLHDQQQRDIELVSDDSEVVIPAGEDESLALTVAYIRVIHEEQEKDIKANDYPDDIVIAGSDGEADLTRAEITALHERQLEMLEGDEGIPAPQPELGSLYMSVEETKELHENQSQQ